MTTPSAPSLPNVNLTKEQAQAINPAIEGAARLAELNAIKNKVAETGGDNDKDEEQKENKIQKAERWYQEDKKKFLEKMKEISNRNPGGDFIKLWDEFIEKLMLIVATPAEERPGPLNEARSCLRRISDPKLREEATQELYDAFRGPGHKNLKENKNAQQIYEEKHIKQDKENQTSSPRMPN